MYSALGIDIGKLGIHVAIPVHDLPAKRRPVKNIHYAQPQWHEQLIAMIAPGAIICFEPTGWHYSAPIISIITQMTTGQIWLVGHGTTGKVRGVHVAAAKTDEMDARALALVATWVRNGQPPANCRQHNIDLEQQVQRLRQMVNHLFRATKQSTRLTNRLHAFAHAIHPQLDISYSTWLANAQKGIITPKDIHNHVASLPQRRDRRTTRHIETLAAALPPIDAPHYTVESIQETIAQLAQIEDEIYRLEHACSGNLP